MKFSVFARPDRVALSPARYALSGTFVGVGILGRVGMPFRAVSLGDVPCRKGFTAEEIRPSSNRFEMFRIDAPPVAAQVVDVHPGRNLSVREDV